MADEPVVTPPTDDPKPEPVKDPEAVLAKNKELLGKLAAEKAEREAALARIAEFEKKESDAERAKLEKKGEWEKLRDSMEKSHTETLTAEQTRYNALFNNASRYQLAVELSKHELAEGANAEHLSKLLLDEIKPVEEKGGVIWRKIETDEEVKLNEFIPSIKDAYGNFFKADNNPGGDAPGNNGKTTTTNKKWSEATLAERNDAIRAAGGDVDRAKKNFK